ncbi:MAG: tyrosine-type recombinase/integrase [Ancalomicrobiaceae bacterium]|nr:tyrosine-type recombinase/integrase [Ancalomicrobiaceae bacterium]
MDNIRIAKRTVDALEATGAEYFAWDADLIGFGVRVRESGAKSYIVKYRAGTGRSAPTRRITLGAVGKLTPDEARRLAKTRLGEAATGGDPAADRAKERAEILVAQLADLYLAEGCDTKKPSTVLNDRSRVERHIKPLLGSKRVGQVTTADIAKAMRDVANGATAMDKKTDAKKGRAIVTGGKGAANQVVLLLSAIFTFAMSRQIRKDNPAIGVKKYQTNKGERFLTTEELDRLGAAIREAETDGIEWQVDEERALRPTAKHAPKRPESRRTKIGAHVAAALRLLIMTGARLREILNLEWSHVDVERGLLFLPDSKTGKKTIVLNAPALAVLAGLPHVGRFVIPGEMATGPDGQRIERPRSDLKRPWDLICRRAGLEGVRLHDLRHTHASFGAAAGLGLPIIGKLLGHTQASTTARYAHLDNDPLRKASDRIGADIARAMGDAPASGGAEVVPIRRDGRG